jgi:hypothetical protein
VRLCLIFFGGLITNSVSASDGKWNLLPVENVIDAAKAPYALEVGAGSPVGGIALIGGDILAGTPGTNLIPAQYPQETIIEYIQRLEQNTGRLVAFVSNGERVKSIKLKVDISPSIVSKSSISVP